MEHLIETTESLRRYQPATTHETKSLYKTLTQVRSINQQEYRKRFVQGTNPKRPSHLRFSPSKFQMDTVLPLRKVFHDGLVKDEDGTYWIIKTQNSRARYDLTPREARNSARHERLAYLLALGRANFAEIRRLPNKNQYLTRVVTAENLNSSGLPHRSASEAYAAILVANIFMRKWDQHLNNFAFAGDMPVCIDHDVIGPATTFPHTPSGRSSFNLALLSFKLVSILPSLCPRHEVDVRAKELLKHHFIHENDREAWWIMRDLIHGLGLGAGLLGAETLKTADLRNSVQAFKSVRSIDRLAEQAGFQGRDLETITTYLVDSQKRLGNDVGEVWRNLTGDNARLDLLD